MRHVLRGVGQLRQINEIAVERLVVAHAFDSLAHILVVLDRLDQAAIFIENLLDLCRTRRRWTGPGINRRIAQ